MNIALAILLVLAATSQDPPVEHTKKNIKVLQGLPSSQLIPVMTFMANSLGVTCAHCHVKDWELDEKPEKNAARRMIDLQRAINKQHYDDKLVITCNTCHQGHAKPPATPDIAHAGWNVAHPPPGVVRGSAAPPPEDALEARATPPADESIPGEDAIPQLWSTSSAAHRVIRGIVERYSGRDEPKSGAFTLTVGPSFDYKPELSHPPEAARALALYLLTPPKPEQLHGERWTITSGAVRRERETATPLGTVPERIDFEDFRQTDSGRLPFRTRWSRGDYRVTYIIESVKSE